MPNYITNRMKVTKGEYDLSTFDDFEKIIPMPKELDIEAYHHSDRIKNLYVNGRAETEHEKMLVENYKLQLINQRNLGHCTWHSWRTKNWGTKWNMSERQSDDDGIEFQTAWSTPKPIFEKISESLDSETEIQVYFADEDTGYNCGTLTITKDNVDDFMYEGGSDEAILFSLKVRGLEDQFKLVDGELVEIEGEKK